MAIITLKDLMDPLAKIAAATEKTAQKLDAVLAVVTGGSAASLNQEIIKELKTQTNLLQTIAGNTRGSILTVDGKPVDTDKLKEGAEAIKILGGGAASLAYAMLTFMLVPKAAVTKFTDVVKGLSSAFDNIDTGKLKEGAEAIAMMSSTIGKFARNLVLASVTAMIGIVFVPFFIAAVLSISMTFMMIGKMNSAVEHGADTLTKISKGLAWFSVGLITFALSTMFILTKPVVILAMVGILLVIGGTFALLGLLDKNIKKGAVALFTIGASLVMFSIGYLIFALSVNSMTAENIGIQTAVLLGTGITVGLLGLGWSSIVKGAIAVAAVGLGLMIFGLGYLPFAMVMKNTTMADVGTQLALLLGLGLEFTAAGFGAPFILAGAGAFAAVGIALLLLAPGLTAIKKVNFNETDSLNLATMLTGVKTAFLGGDTAGEGFFKKIGGAITGVVDSVRMIESAAGFVAAGIALKTLSWGLSAFKKIEWNDQLSLELTTVLTGITGAFAQAGGEPSNPGGFFGRIFGNAFSPNATGRGVSSIMGAGRALTGIANGLISFQKLIDRGIKFGTPNADGTFEKGTLGYAITNTVGFIRTAFAAVANEGNVKGGGFFNTLFDIKSNKVEEGIRSVKGVGSELTGIANGLKTFQVLVEKQVNWDKLGEGISKSLTFVGSAFAAIGGQEQSDSSMFGLIKWDENLVEKGVNAVKGAGKELMNIATGLKTFESLKNPKIIANNIKSIFTSIGDTFTFYYKKPRFKAQLDHMKGFISDISIAAHKGYLNKAATGIGNIAKAVNSIDSNKAESFANLFKGAGQLTENQEAFKALVKAVEDIREALASTAKQSDAVLPSMLKPIQAEPKVETAQPSINAVPQQNTQQTGLQPVLNNINLALSRLDGTLRGLPAQIQSIKIVVPE